MPRTIWKLVRPVALLALSLTSIMGASGCALDPESRTVTWDDEAAICYYENTPVLFDANTTQEQCSALAEAAADGPVISKPAGDTESTDKYEMYCCDCWETDDGNCVPFCFPC